MPPITRLFIKASLLYFVAALLLAIIQAMQALRPFSPYAAALGPVYYHTFLVGWITQIIIGVALWMFPKYSQQQPRRSDRLSYIIFALLNSGLLLRALAEPPNTLYPGLIWGPLLALSAILQWLGGLGFIINLWPRVKEK